jgi:hypothetical protein
MQQFGRQDIAELCIWTLPKGFLELLNNYNFFTSFFSDYALISTCLES